MTQKFPFNHFLKLDNLQDGSALNRGEANPLIIEQSLKSLPLNASKAESIKVNSDFSSEELKSITDALLENIKNLITPNKFHAFFANTFTVSAINQNVVEIVVTTSFIKTMIENQFPEIIKQGLLEILGKEFDIDIQVLGNPSPCLSSNTDNILNSVKPKKSEPVKNASFFLNELEPTKEDLIRRLILKSSSTTETMSIAK